MTPTFYQNRPPFKNSISNRLDLVRDAIRSDAQLKTQVAHAIEYYPWIGITTDSKSPLGLTVAQFEIIYLLSSKGDNNMKEQLAKLKSSNQQLYENTIFEESFKTFWTSHYGSREKIRCVISEYQKAPISVVEDIMAIRTRDICCRYNLVVPKEVSDSITANVILNLIDAAWEFGEDELRFAIATDLEILDKSRSKLRMSTEGIMAMAANGKESNKKGMSLIQQERHLLIHAKIKDLQYSLNRQIVLYQVLWDYSLLASPRSIFRILADNKRISYQALFYTESAFSHFNLFGGTKGRFPSYDDQIEDQLNFINSLKMPLPPAASSGAQTGKTFSVTVTRH